MAKEKNNKSGPPKEWNNIPVGSEHPADLKKQELRKEARIVGYKQKIFETLNSKELAEKYKKEKEKIKSEIADLQGGQTELEL